MLPVSSHATDLCWSMGEMNATSFSAHVLDSCSGREYTIHTISTNCPRPFSTCPLSHPLLTPPPHPTPLHPTSSSHPPNILHPYFHLTLSLFTQSSHHISFTPITPSPNPPSSSHPHPLSSILHLLHPTSHTSHSPHLPLHHYRSRRTALSYPSRHSQTEQLPGIAPPPHSRCYSAAKKHLIRSKPK